VRRASCRPLRDHSHLHAITCTCMHALPASRSRRGAPCWLAWRRCFICIIGLRDLRAQAGGGCVHASFVWLRQIRAPCAPDADRLASPTSPQRTRKRL